MKSWVDFWIVSVIFAVYKYTHFQLLFSSEEHILRYQWQVLALDLLLPGARGRVGPGELELVTRDPEEDSFQSGRIFLVDLDTRFCLLNI